MGRWQRAGILTLLIAAVVGGGVAYVAVTNRKRGKRWDLLWPETKRKVNELEAVAKVNGLDVMFWDGWRDPKTTLENIAKGTSKVKDAFGSGHTWGSDFDIVFRGAGGLPSWPDGILTRPDGSEYINPQWLKLGRLGEALGLSWGGRWRTLGTVGRKGSGLFDGPHFQLPRSMTAIRGQYGTNYVAFLKTKGVVVV